jgi:hypothetical protein
VLSTRPLLAQEVDTGGSVAVVRDVARHHVVAGSNQLTRDGAVAAGRLPDGAVKALDARMPSGGVG